jgi:hypothetical protein
MKTFPLLDSVERILFYTKFSESFEEKSSVVKINHSEQ